MYSYNDIFERNIGFISKEDQDKLKNNVIAVFGVGGLGAVACELLVRCGIGHIKMIEPDEIEASNINRHVFAYQDNVGQKKNDVAFDFLKKINPSIKIELFDKESNSNLDDILSNVDCIIMAADKIHASMLVTRKAHDLNIPLVEGWAIPFANVRVFTKDTPTFEEVYNLPTIGKKVEDLSKEEIKQADLQMLFSLQSIEGVPEFYTKEAVERIQKGINPSFAPFVWLTAVLMAIEGIKVLLNWGKINLAPNWALYNPIEHNIPKQLVTV